MDSTIPASTSAQPEFLSGGGEIGKLIRAYPWEETALGYVEQWPQSFRSALSICLNSNFPIGIYWGKELTLLYNDAWSPIPGNKHPWALGKPAKEVWPEIWDAIEPQFKKAFTGEPGGSKDALLPMQRHGYTEECYFDFTFTPVYGEAGKVEGVFNAVIETTYRVINERRTAFLKNFSQQIASVTSKTQLFEQALAELEQASADISFASVYSFKDGKPELVGSTLEELAQEQIREWPLSKVLHPATTICITDLENYFSKPLRKYWPEPLAEAYIMPVTSGGDTVGIFVLGLSARRRFDEDYRLFLDAINNTVSNAFTLVSAIEEERKKAEALAEIDKAKTTFFSNISHEFRTPLTLMLGSLDELLRKPQNEIGAGNLRTLETTQRNAIRLLRLVNNLLDFSRIEAGKARARYQLTDIGRLTEEVAGSFRSLVENAGLKLNVSCDAIIQPVYVDRIMWEKIVLNLLSNAFKYTLQGSISISLSAGNQQVILSVKDTGVGIPEKDLPHMFERFHRVENSRGRTYEGTGIGLSLINELVRMHNGRIEINSREGEGSEFLVIVPTGKQHLKQDEVIDADVDEDFILPELIANEASMLKGDDDSSVAPVFEKDRPVVMVVDDNADMRQYITSILKKTYNVITANNGMDALLKLPQHPPALIVSDIMMPVMDGIKLLQAIKEQPTSSTIPVILVSARAGEEERIEGYDLGADDYLVKPFSSRELVAKVRSQINLAKKRNDTIKDVFTLWDAVPFGVAALRGNDLQVEFLNQYILDVWGKSKEDVLGKPLFKALPLLERDAAEIHKRVYQTGKRFVVHESPFTITKNGSEETRYFSAIIDPMRDDAGRIIGQLVTTIEVTEQVITRKKLEESENTFRKIIESSPDPICILKGEDLRLVVANYPLLKLWQVERNAIGEPLEKILPDMAGQGSKERLMKVLKNHETIHGKEVPGTFHRQNGKVETFYFNYTYQPFREADGSVTGVMITASDVTHSVESRKLLEESERSLRAAKDQVERTIENVPAAVFLFDDDGNIIFANRQAQETLIKILGREYRAGESVQSLLKTASKKVQLFDEHDAPINESMVPTFIALKENREAELMMKRVYKETGKTEWLINRSIPLFDEQGNLQFVLSLSTDLTEQKEAELKLRESEKKFHTLADSLPQMVWMRDADGNIEFGSKHWQEYSGIENINDAWSAMVHPEDRDLAMHSWEDHVMAGAPFRFEVRLKNRKGEYRWHLSIAEPLRDDKGNIIKWIGSINDIHTQKSFSESLETLVAERTKLLERSNEDLLQFAHVASHDLKEPVRKVMIFAHRLKEELGESSNEKTSHYLGKIESAAERMYAMVDGVLQYSSFNALEQAPTEIDLNSLLQTILNDLELPIEEKEARILLEKLPVITGSAILVYQLFYNLINNALKFSKPGEKPVIRIEAQTASKEELISRQLPGEGRYAKIIITDNGIGFSNEDAEKIFGTFTRLHSKVSYEGTGLGLSLCRKIALRHNGSIYAEGALNQGARFVILWPV